ncbi:hypothetical protein [Bacillus sp. 1P06AnD]|uniref:hypothetical protein n=1 Tax=Bacillus sp. 1P06AnD TaxID=3132208 RepID=UPI0039A1B444
MAFLDQFIEVFWKEIRTCKKESDYQLLLEKVELLSTEMLKGATEDKEFSQSPLLAMIAEVYTRCPEVIESKAKENNFYKVALHMISQYTSEELTFLRNHSLQMPFHKGFIIDRPKKIDD